MYAAVPNLNSYFDAVAAHPYSGSSAPDDPRGGWGFPRIADIHQKFIDHGAGDKPLWLTEIGWSTCPAAPDYCTSEKNQAAYLSQMFTLLSTKYSSYVDAAFVYHRTDLNSKPSDKEGWFGLERLDGSHKPVFDVFREAAPPGPLNTLPLATCRPALGTVTGDIVRSGSIRVGAPSTSVQ